MFDFPTELEPWQQLLLDAAKIVRVRWLQGTAGVVGGPRCPVGAVYEVLGLPLYLAVDNQAARTALARLNESLGPSFSIAKWNDSPDRTAEDVASAMEAAAMEKVRV